MRCFLIGTLLLVASNVSYAQQRLWLAPSGDSPTSQASIHPRFVPEHSLPSTITFDTQVVALEPIDQADLALTILDPAGTAIHTGKLSLDLANKVAPAIFTWNPESLADGVYAAHFVLNRRTGGTLAEHRLAVRLLTGPNISAKVDAVEVEAARLRSALGAFGGRSVPAYAALHTVVINDYLPVATAALAAGDWQKAADFADYLANLAEVTIAELSIVTPATESSWPRVPALPAPITIREGAFETEKGPVFLFGASYDSTLASQLPVLERYGLDLAVYRLGLAESMDGPDIVSGATHGLLNFLEEAQKRGVRVVVQLAPDQLPTWAREAMPVLADGKGGSFGYDLMAPAARALLARHTRTVSELVSGHPGLLSISLAENPALRLPDEVLREGLITVASARYKDYHHMNREWKTRYMSFDEIEVDWDSRRRAYRYDLQTYHQELGTQLFSWLAGMGRESAPGIPVQVQFADSAFDLQETMGGIDLESILASMDINGCETTQPLDGEQLAIGPSIQASYYSLLRSLNPAPVMNTADGFVIPAPVTGYGGFGRVRTMMWEAVMAGLNGSAIDFGRPGESGVLGRPELIDGYATAHLDVNRLAPIITSFQRAPAPVRILWSMSSKIFDHGDPFLASARRAYEGCAGFGLHVRFISEREIEREGLGGVEVLVIPRALALTDDAFHVVNHFIQRGGVAVRQGTSIPYTEHGIGRVDTISVSTRTIYIRGEDTPRAYLDALDAAYDLKGLSETPRLVNEFGYPLDGVKSRFVVHQRVPYLYLVNLRENPVTAKLTGNYTSGLDLVSGNRMQFSDTIEPLTPMLIQLEGPPPAQIAINDVPQTVPATELEPTLDNKELVKPDASPGPPLRHGR